MPVARRLVLAAAALLPLGAGAQAAGAGTAAPALRRGAVMPGGPPDEVWDVWPGRPPGGERVAAWASAATGGAPPPRPALAGDIRGYARPVLAVWRPRRATGGSLLVLPGGGYRFVSWDNEGSSVARRLLPTGATIYGLAYRLPGRPQR